MKIQLIFNEDAVKALTPISLNTAGEFLMPAMFEAQEIRLKTVLGSRLLRALKEREQSHDWDAIPYADLKEQCTMFLVYQTICYLIPKVQYKIANVGAVQTSDDKVQNLSREQTDALIEEYQSKADWFCYELQKWLLANEKQFPELDACHCNEIRSNLESMHSCGIWLGGPRAKIIHECDC